MYETLGEQLQVWFGAGYFIHVASPQERETVSNISGGTIVRVRLSDCQQTMPSDCL